VGNRQVVERFTRAVQEDDFDSQDALIHDDFILDYPQSGERIRGRANRRALIESYPGRVETEMRPKLGRIIGADDQFVTPPLPAWNVIHLSGSGDEFQLTGTIEYPDGKTWHFVALITLREGKIWREVDYFAESFDPPAWRAQYVERTET
jgi:limonene-1,2-epoxide hydrolase